MSQDAFTQFMNRLEGDKALRSAFEERFGDASAKIPAKELIQFAADQGYEFTIEDAARELPDEALEGVVGGSTYYTLDNVTLNYEKIDWTYNQTGDDTEDSTSQDSWSTEERSA